MAIFQSLYRSQREARAASHGYRRGKDLHHIPARVEVAVGQRPQNHPVLFLTDRNSLKDQAYRAFSAFDSRERVVVDKARLRAASIWSEGLLRQLPEPDEE
jgi:type I restriction enzyme R subunit